MTPVAGPSQGAARLPRQRLDGVLLIDKPKGPGSTAVLGRVKFLLNAEKAGHTGTLDPLASGLLPLCFGEATKFAQDLLDADKSYRAWLRLGMTTESGDAEGRVMNTRPVTCEPSDIDQVLQRFLGEQQQIPPMHSALKHQGQPLYQLARKGQSVQRQARRVVIHALRRVSVVADCLVIDVTCSKGTYVRVLAEDIGEMLGCGAHLSDLRRTRVGDLAVEAAVTPELLELEALAARQARLLPTDRLVSTLPKMTLEPELARRFSLGQRIFLPDAPPAERLGVYGGIDVQLPTHFLGVAQIDAEGVLRPLRLMSAARS